MRWVPSRQVVENTVCRGRATSNVVPDSGGRGHIDLAAVCDDDVQDHLFAHALQVGNRSLSTKKSPGPEARLLMS